MQVGYSLRSIQIVMAKGDNLSKAELQIRKRIEKRYKKRTEFFQMLIGLGMLNFVIWNVFSPVGVFMMAAQCFAAITVLAIGMTGMELFFMEVQERAVQRELDRERDARYGGDYGYDYDKPKREDSVRLADLSVGEDGELIEIDDEDDYDNGRRQRRRS